MTDSKGPFGCRGHLPAQGWNECSRTITAITDAQVSPHVFLSIDVGNGRVVKVAIIRDDLPSGLKTGDHVSYVETDESVSFPNCQNSMAVVIRSIRITEKTPATVIPLRP